MPAHVRTVEVPKADRRELQRRVRDKGAPARVVERARIVLLAAEVVPGKQIAAIVGCAEGTVVTWRGRYAERGLAGLEYLPRSGKSSSLPKQLRDRVLELTLTEPPTQFAATHWSSRLLATALAGEGTPISHATVARIRHRFGVQPWRAQTFKFSTDPELEPRSATSSGCICIRRRRRWCSAWMRSRRFRRGSAPPRRCRCGPGTRRRPASTTAGTAPPRCSPHWRWPPGGSPRPAPSAPPPGVPGLPAPGGSGLSAPAAARGGGQPVHPQASGGAFLAGAPSPGDPALPADLGVVAEPGRGVPLDHHPPGAASRQLPTVTDLIAAIEGFIAAWNDRCRPFTWTKDLDTVIAKATDPRHRKTPTTSDTEH